MAELLAMRLKREGYDVTVAGDGAEALEKIRSAPPDLVLLDLMLPKMSGTDLAGELRGDPRTASVPIIFSMSVLLARIAAVLRRTDERGVPGKGVLTVGPIRIDTEAHRVEVDGKAITLTLTEFRILTALAAARGRVLTRNHLIDQVMGLDAVVTDRTIDVHLTALRKKLGKARSIIQTVRGVGYRVADENEDEAT